MEPLEARCGVEFTNAYGIKEKCTLKAGHAKHHRRQPDKPRMDPQTRKAYREYLNGHNERLKQLHEIASGRNTEDYDE